MFSYVHSLMGVSSERLHLRAVAFNSQMLLGKERIYYISPQKINVGVDWLLTKSGEQYHLEFFGTNCVLQ